jgi:haloalkane dehalogenase
MTTALEAFLAAPIERIHMGTELTYRRFGQGPAVVLVHGWPLNGATYRGLVRILQQHFTCYVPDLPGCGETPWDPRTREVFSDWGPLLVRFVEALGLSRVALVAHDSGGLIARIAAAQLGERVALLALINTEVPDHVPFLIKAYTELLRVPGSRWLFAKMLGFRWYRRTRFGFAACFHDPAHLDGDFHRACVEPLLADPSAMIRTFVHFDSQVVLQLRDIHRSIKAPTVLIWGQDDPFFPVERARAMTADFADMRGFHVLPGQSLFVHDEAPELVAAPLVSLLQRVHHASEPDQRKIA